MQPIGPHHLYRADIRKGTKRGTVPFLYGPAGTSDARHPGADLHCPKAVQMQRIPDVFEIPEPMRGKPLPWLTAVAMTAIVVVATLALVVANEVPSEPPQVTVGR